MNMNIAMRTGLSPRGYWLAKQDMTQSEMQSVKDELTMRPVNVGFNAEFNTVRFDLFRDGRTKLYVPKYYGLQKYGAPTEVNKLATTGAPLPSTLDFKGSLRADQIGPINKFLDAARDPLKMGGILSLPCGFGKTVSALYLVKELGVKTLVVVHKEFLLKQWKERIEQFLPGAAIGILKAQTIDVQDKDIVIASLQSLSMKTYSETIFSDVGFLIIDECHRVGTEVFSRALHKINFRYSLGISATVRRKDGMTKAFSNFLGDVVFSGDRKKMPVKVIRKQYNHPEDYVYKREETVFYQGKHNPNISKMINNITSFKPRTAFIVEAAVRYVKDNARKVLILSDRKSQLTQIHEGVKQQGVSVGFYWGSMKESDLNESEKCSVMCATYAYASEGMDVPSLDTLIMASPKSDVQQSCGRILRKTDGNPLILDIVDEFSIFFGQSKKRLKFYRAEGYTQVDENDIISGDGEPENKQSAEFNSFAFN
jgi:superfamily II DNA or RNA helicase